MSMKIVVIGEPGLIRVGLPHSFRARRQPFGATMFHDRHGDGRQQVGDR
jgi:hypothetical protein